MNSDDLTKAQLERLVKSLYPHRNFLVRLKTRMEKRGFPVDDKLYRLTIAAYDACQALSHACYYMRCNGVGDPFRKQQPPKERHDGR